MRFERMELTNFKPYAEATVRLSPGVTVIHGPNGSGKSSLLEACFFALYGANPPFEPTLDEVVTTGTDEAEIDLWFSHGGVPYHLHRRIRIGGDRASTADCVLKTPGGTVEGVGDVEAHVRELLRMDAEAFVNCAYVRQGEINKLINASPKERQRMIDELLQLGRLEEYRERAGHARLAVERLHERWEDRLDDREHRIEEREAEDLHGRRNALLTERNELDEQIERFETNREQAKESLAEAESVLGEHEERAEELQAVIASIEELREKIADTEREREAIGAEIRERREAIETAEERIAERLSRTELDEADADAIAARRGELTDRVDELREDVQAVRLEVQERNSQAETHTERASELRERAHEARERADELDAEAEQAVAKVEEARAKLETLEGDVADKRSTFEEAPVAVGGAEAYLESLEEELAAVRERETSVREELATAQSRVEDAEALLEAGKCPECGQPVDGSPHVDHMEDYRERVSERAAELEGIEEQRDQLDKRIARVEELRSLEGEIDSHEAELESIEQLVTERVATVEERREQAKAKREAAETFETEAETADEAAEEAREEAEAAREQLGELNAKLSELKERIERLDDLATTVDDRDEAAAEIERLRERRDELADRNDERREHLAEATERKDHLEAEYDEDRVEEARGAREGAEAYLEQVDGKLAALDDRRSELQGELGAVENAIEELESLRDERDEIETRVQALASLQTEAEQLEGMYGDLRTELRQQNVARLERLLNETFDLVYQNDSYARIELSPSYELTVYQKDGESLDPDQLSGGERALFNLSLRTAVYRLLAEGIEGSAPMPPLVLDEPTVFLDAGHVSQLVELIDAMRELGVEQIIVVSHDDELVGAADDVLTVRKDPTTNRSTVEREAQVSAPAD